MQVDVLKRVLLNGGIILLVCSALYWIFWRKYPAYFSRWKVQPGSVRPGDLKRDIGWSFITLFVLKYPLLSVVIWVLHNGAWFDTYEPLDSPANLARFVWSFGLFLVILDAVRYWTHRAYHIPIIYRHVHSLHHRTLSPTPFSAFCAHPVEAVVSMSTPILVMLVVKVHYLVPLLYSWFALATDIERHLGHDFFTRWTTKVPLLRQITFSGFHDFHHTNPDKNYSNLFCWWDHWMGTAHPKFTKSKG